MGTVLPDATGETAIVRVTDTGTAAKFAVTVASPVRVVVVSSDSSSSTVAFPTMVQLTK